jgi:ABC-type sugar transport system ATPase subunit
MHMICQLSPASPTKGADGIVSMGSGSAGQGPEPPAPPILRITGVSKTFPGTVALDNVSLDVAPGEIHALVGQNGSGKSTLIKVLAGYHRADPGSQAWLNGEPVDLGGTAGSRHHRLRFVHQDLGLFLELGAVDNLALRGQFITDPVHRIRWKAQAEAARELLGRFGLDLDLRKPLAEATPVQRTVVAIAAALVGWEGGPGLLVLDEPTAVLPPHDVASLLEIIRGVRDQGTSILYVSHRLDEVFEIADRVTVLRGGRVVATRPVQGLDVQALAELMVGADVDAGYRAGLPAADTREVVLRAQDVQSRFLRGVDVELREGEVLGVAGLPGSGRDELPYRFPADRGRESVISEFSVGENLTISVLDRFRRFGLLRRRPERELVGEWMNSIEVKAGSQSAPITTLSGGNQQKVMMARCLARDPRVLVLCEPTAGVDVGTRQAIYEFIADRARAGLSLLVSSSDTGDLLAICTRVSRRCCRRWKRRSRYDNSAADRQRALEAHAGRSRLSPARRQADQLARRPERAEHRRGLRTDRDLRHLLDLGPADVPRDGDDQAGPGQQRDYRPGGPRADHPAVDADVRPVVRLHHVAVRRDRRAPRRVG